MQRDEVVALMESSRSSQEWTDNCLRVKAAHGGRYPAFWYEAVLLSGLARRTMAKYGCADEITVPKEVSPRVTLRANPPFLAALRVGDEVTRMLCGTIPMKLKVTALDGGLIRCGAWAFDRTYGYEVDEQLAALGASLGMEPGVVSWLVPEGG